MIPRSEKTAQFQVRDGQFLADRATRVSQAAEERTVRLRCRLVACQYVSLPRSVHCSACVPGSVFALPLDLLIKAEECTAGIFRPCDAPQCEQYAEAGFKRRLCQRAASKMCPAEQHIYVLGSMLATLAGDTFC